MPNAVIKKGSNYRTVQASLSSMSDEDEEEEEEEEEELLSLSLALFSSPTIDTSRGCSC